LATGAWLELDLLRRRREQMGLSAPRPVPARALILRGTLMGAGVVALALLACLAAAFYGGWLQQRERQLKPDADAYDQAQARIGQVTKELTARKADNQALADAVAGVRSGSALLTEVAQLIPQGLQLTKLKVLGSSLEISGAAQQPLGLDQINGFQLQLEGSPFFQPDGVSLAKAEEVSTTPAAAVAPGTPAAPAAQPITSLNFELKAELAADAAKLTRNRLQALGSLGLARRVELLRRDGLLP
jgi:Tfp pilus assembly protein PilN